MGKRIDIGCGPNKKEGFIGIDKIAFPNVDIVIDIGMKKWPFEDECVDEAHCSHFLEHLKAAERIHFANELHRVLAPGAKAQIITPHWSSNRAYGDMTHEWPPVSEMFNYYLSRDWRKANAPHTDKEWNADGFDCDFDVTWGYALHPEVNARNPELQQKLITFTKEAAQDMIACWMKKVR